LSAELTENALLQTVCLAISPTGREPRGFYERK